MFQPLYEPGITKVLQSFPACRHSSLQPVPLWQLKDFPSYSQVEID